MRRDLSGHQEADSVKVYPTLLIPRTNNRKTEAHLLFHLQTTFPSTYDTDLVLQTAVSSKEDTIFKLKHIQIAQEENIKKGFKKETIYDQVISLRS